MNWYFIVLMFLEAISLGINLAKHGEAKDGDYNFFISLTAAVINTFLIVMAIKKGF